jgi:hypothetical protein
VEFLRLFWDLADGNLADGNLDYTRFLWNGYLGDISVFFAFRTDRDRYVGWEGKL